MYPYSDLDSVSSENTEVVAPEGQGNVGQPPRNRPLNQRDPLGASIYDRLQVYLLKWDEDTFLEKWELLGKKNSVGSSMGTMTEEMWNGLALAALRKGRMNALSVILKDWPQNMVKPQTLYNITLQAVESSYRAQLTENQVNNGQSNVWTFFGPRLPMFVSNAILVIETLVEYGVFPTEAQQEQVAQSGSATYPQEVVDKIAKVCQPGYRPSQILSGCSIS